MKPSHLQTPRQLGDAGFVPSADPIEKLDTQRHRHDQIVVVGCMLAAVACAVIIAVWG